jgi:hypothetical protein
MADTKISALTASTTPLAGTEVLPIVQGGVTKQVSVADLTAGRAISATELTLSTGNLVIGTSGKGIDFSATPGTGTSELLADYEEGTWTPTVGAGAGSITSYTASGKYTKTGRQVVLTCTINITVNGTGSAFILVSNLPFSTDATVYTAYGHNNTVGGSISGATTGTLIYVNKYDGTYPGASATTLLLTSVYFV